MNEYLAKDVNGAASSIFRILHEKVDHQKQMAFRFLHSNINVSKFGFQIEREFHMELEQGKEQLELLEPQSGHIEMDFGSEPEEESPSVSDDEQVQLNRQLKQGRRQGRAILLGEDVRRRDASGPKLEGGNSREG